jgi:hypothetical protein
MLYIRFAHVALKRKEWDVFSSGTPAKPIARVKQRKGQCSAAITPDHALNREELAGLLDFMAATEQRQSERVC